MEVVFTESILNSHIFKLIVASILGAIIGLERSIHGRPAGLRTNLLVSLGAAVFMILSESIAIHYTTVFNESSIIRTDATRIAAQIVTGIGFLGAGVIIKNGLSVRGLTTAACLWISASIGMSIGAGYYQIGIVTTIISLFALTVLNKAENYHGTSSYRILEIFAPLKTDTNELANIIKRKDFKIIGTEKEKNYEENTLHLTYSIKVKHKKTLDRLFKKLIQDLEDSPLKMHKIKWYRE